MDYSHHIVTVLSQHSDYMRHFAVYISEEVAQESHIDNDVMTIRTLSDMLMGMIEE